MQKVGTEDFYIDIAKDVETSFGKCGYSNDDNRSLPIGKNKKAIAMMKDELTGKFITESVALRADMYAYRKLDKKLQITVAKVQKSV